MNANSCMTGNPSLAQRKNAQNSGGVPKAPLPYEFKESFRDAVASALSVARIVHAAGACQIRPIFARDAIKAAVGVRTGFAANLEIHARIR